MKTEKQDLAMIHKTVWLKKTSLKSTEFNLNIMYTAIHLSIV